MIFDHQFLLQRASKSFQLSHLAIASHLCDTGGHGPCIPHVSSGKDPYTKISKAGLSSLAVSVFAAAAKNEQQPGNRFQDVEESQLMDNSERRCGKARGMAQPNTGPQKNRLRIGGNIKAQ
jgi:hypothetical protein